MSMPNDFLSHLASLPAGRCRRVSSNEQPNWNDGNFDSIHLDPGDVLDVPILEGPGYINHMWFTSHAGGMGELNALTLRIYWDGAKEPAVEAPMGDFFACGDHPAEVESVPVQVSPSGALTCYWRMPFKKSARITVTNDNPERGYGLYWQVDYVTGVELPADVAYFNAQWRSEYPAKMGQDYLIADLEGKGQYVGTVLTVTNAQDGWFGEGDDFFFIDGEAIPSLQGTGSEDYFNDGWGFRKRTSLWFGQPHSLGYESGEGGILYRWHVLDPVHFAQSLKLTIEHKGNWPYSEDAWYLERPDYFSSVAFWYQAGEAKRFGSLPGYVERSVPWAKHHFVPKLRDGVCTGKSKLQVTTMGMFGGRPSLRWKGLSKGDTVTFPFTLKEEGRYAANVCAFRFGGGDGACFPREDGTTGNFAIELDGKAVVEDTNFDTLEYNEPSIGLGEHILKAGEHKITFRAKSDGAGDLGLEFMRTLCLPPLAIRVNKTHNEAHFFRLGIGRAVYAYKLAYGELPASLKQLVDLEIMEAMYLKDEHGNPVEVWLEGERFFAKSTTPGGWTHSWKGADARR
jgi:hypothetical protein